MKRLIIFLLTVYSSIPGSRSLPTSPELHEFPLPGPPPDLFNLTGLYLSPINSSGPITSWGTLKCETSNASPPVSESKVIIEKLKKRKDKCMQSNAGGSKCQRYEWHKSAEAAVCGKWSWFVWCKELGWALEQVVKGCESKGRAGGQWVFGQELRGILY
jgi:hypothetical protein